MESDGGANLGKTGHTTTVFTPSHLTLLPHSPLDLLPARSEPLVQQPSGGPTAQPCVVHDTHKRPHECPRWPRGHR